MCRAQQLTEVGHEEEEGVPHDPWLPSSKWDPVTMKGKKEGGKFEREC